MEKVSSAQTLSWNYAKGPSFMNKFTFNNFFISYHSTVDDFSVDVCQASVDLLQEQKQR